MQRNNSAIVDFSQEGTSEQFFARTPMLTSHRSGWSSLHLEQHSLSETDTGEHHLTQHCICLALNNFVCERWLDDRFYTDFCQRGTIGIIPADVMHRAVSSDNEINFMTLSLSQDFLDQVTQDWNFGTLQPVPHTATQEDFLLLGIGLSLKAEIESGCLGGRLYEESLATAFAVHLLRRYCDRTLQLRSYSTGLSASKLKRVLNYINDNLDQDLSLEAIAAQAEMSQYYFCSLFKRSVGISPWKYVIEQRILRAKALLKTTRMSLSEIALRCGFANQNHLNKQFRKLVGITPKVYREK